MPQPSIAAGWSETSSAQAEHRQGALVVDSSASLSARERNSSRLGDENGVDQENGSGRESASNQRNSALSTADHRCLAKCEKICCDS